MKINTKHIEEQIINLFIVYFNPKAKFKFKLKKKQKINRWFLSDEERKYDNPFYHLDYKNPNFSYDEPSKLFNKIYAEIDSLNTENSKLIFAMDADESSMINIIDYMYRTFSLQTEYIADDDLFYNNKMKDLFQLVINTNHQLNDFARRSYVRNLLWNLNLSSELSHIYVINSLIYYQDTHVKTLLIKLLEDINNSKQKIIVAQDYITFIIELLEVLERGFTEYDLISEVGFCKETAKFCHYGNFLQTANIDLDRKMLKKLQKLATKSENFQDLFLYRMAMFNFINIYFAEKKSRLFFKEYNERGQ